MRVSLTCALIALTVYGCGGGGGSDSAPQNTSQNTGSTATEGGSGGSPGTGDGCIFGFCPPDGPGPDIGLPPDDLPLDQPPRPVVLHTPSDPVLLTVTLDWTPPTTLTDGSPIFGLLSGYRVYFGSLSGIYTGGVRVLDNPGLVTYVLDLPGPGAHYIVMTAVTPFGTESSFSNEVRVVVL